MAVWLGRWFQVGTLNRCKVATCCVAAEGSASSRPFPGISPFFAFLLAGVRGKPTLMAPTYSA